jgi:hypothetical protein
MNRSLLLCIIFFACAMFSCKKENMGGTKSQYAKLIVGTWKTYEQNIQIYDLNTNQLLRDSTVNFSGTNTAGSWSEIYNENGSAYITKLTKKIGASVATTDTTTYLHYSILGSNITLKQDIGGTETKPILTLTLTDMGLQSTYTGILNSSWGLDTDVTYKIVQASYYTRQ